MPNPRPLIALALSTTLIVLSGCMGGGWDNVMRQYHEVNEADWHRRQRQAFISPYQGLAPGPPTFPHTPPVTSRGTPPIP